MSLLCYCKQKFTYFGETRGYSIDTPIKNKSMAGQFHSTSQYILAFETSSFLETKPAELYSNFR